MHALAVLHKLAHAFPSQNSLALLYNGHIQKPHEAQVQESLPPDIEGVHPGYLSPLLQPLSHNVRDSPRQGSTKCHSFALPDFSMNRVDLNRRSPCYCSAWPERMCLNWRLSSTLNTNPAPDCKSWRNTIASPTIFAASCRTPQQCCHCPLHTATSSITGLACTIHA